MFDETAGFSALMKMFDRDPNEQVAPRSDPPAEEDKIWTTRAPMLALTSPDAALAFPADTVLQPRIFVRNTTSTAIAASVRFNWRSDDKSGSSNLATLAVAAHETQLVDIAALQKNKLIPAEAHWASVELSAPSQPNDLVAVAASYDASLRHGTQTPFNDTLSFMWEGGHWQADSTRDSIITAGNGGRKTIQVRFTLYYDEGRQHYDLEQELKPHEQMWIDVGKLIRNQVADKNGALLPPGLTMGAYTFQDLTDQGVGNLFEGKVVLDKTFGHVAYGCAGCCGYAGDPWMYINPMDLGVSGQRNQDVWDLDKCTGKEVSVLYIGGYGNWRTDNSAVATAANAVVTGVGAGQTTHYATGVEGVTAGNRCLPVHLTPPGPVNVPALGCTASVTRGGTATCTVTPTGVTVTAWQFKDGGGNIVKRAQNVGSLTWSGVMVASGTVSATVSGISSPLTWSIAVSNRTNFAFTAVSPSPEDDPFSSDGCSINVPSPPQQSGDAVGKFCLAQYFSLNTATVNDNGPNNGYSYVTSIPSSSGSSTTGYFYVISPDLKNTSSAFYLAQCGNYNSTAQTGFISGTNLLTDTNRHEAGTVQSHYENYAVAQNNSANNLGTVAEGKTGLESAQALANSVTTVLNQNVQTILSATQVQPCSVQQDASCNFQGCINFSPYYSCSEVVPCVP